MMASSYMATTSLALLPFPCHHDRILWAYKLSFILVFFYVCFCLALFLLCIRDTHTHTEGIKFLCQQVFWSMVKKGPDTCVSCMIGAYICNISVFTKFRWIPFYISLASFQVYCYIFQKYRWTIVVIFLLGDILSRCLSLIPCCKMGLFVSNLLFKGPNSSVFRSNLL
jgi:hypothetical protein